jgi:hypothetical protein
MGFKMNNGRQSGGTGFSAKTALKAGEMWGTSPLNQTSGTKNEVVTVEPTPIKPDQNNAPTTTGKEKKEGDDKASAEKTLAEKNLAEADAARKQQVNQVKGTEQKKEYLLDHLSTQIFNPQTESGKARREGRAERSKVRDTARAKDIRERNTTKLERVERKHSKK